MLIAGCSLRQGEIEGVNVLAHYIFEVVHALRTVEIPHRGRMR